ncbi:MAG: DUF1987 domain-containing protein [Ekhidna sp.]|nr:DUF1987 domain-containing protein [Ekhidna sp.]
MTSLVSNFKIKGTRTTPEISFDPYENSFSISGISIPENTTKFYEPVFKLFEELIETKKDNLKVRINLIHFNTSSSKVLFNLFKFIAKLDAIGSNVDIRWYCDEDDEDMQEIIEDYIDMLGLDIKVETKIEE